MIQIARKFAKGFEEINADDNLELSAKYQYIYKNLLRDIKIYYQDSFKNFRRDQKLTHMGLSKQDKDFLLPPLVLFYVQSKFDHQLVSSI